MVDIATRRRISSVKWSHGCDFSSNRHTKKHQTSRRCTSYAHGAVGPPGDPFGPQWLSPWPRVRAAAPG